MRAVPASLVIAALCAVAWIAWDSTTAARVLMLTLVAAPMLDWLARKAFDSPPARASGPRLPSTLALALWLPVQVALLLWALHAAGSGSLSAVELAQVTLFVGMAGGIFGMSVAHELLHRPGRLARVAADGLLLLALYGHFRIAHLQIHHRLVASADDPATPQRGESIYVFFGRSIVDGLRLSLDLERGRLADRGLRTNVLRDGAVRSGVISLALILTTWLAFGAPAVAVFAGQALIAIYTLEALNYVQHYGLSRERGTAVAWDWDGPFTNWLMLDLGDHVEHHAPDRATDYAGEPIARLPASYLLMIALAAFPPLWRAIMDRRIAGTAFHAPVAGTG